MYRIKQIQNIQWGGGSLDSFCVLDNKNEIVVEPTLYLLHASTKGKKITSIKSYAQDLKMYFEVIANASDKLDWRNVSDNQMSGYIQNYLKGERGVKSSTLTRHIESIKGFYNWAWIVGITDSNRVFSFGYDQGGEAKTSQDGKAKNSLKSQYMTEEDFNNLVSGVDGKTSFKIERDELTLYLSYYCGLRTSEVTDPDNFKTDDLRMVFDAVKKEGRLTCDIEIIGKRSKLRTIIIPPPLFMKIDIFLYGRRLKVPDGPLISNAAGCELSEKFASRIFDNAKAKCDECHERKWLFFHHHSLRHTYATNLVAWCYEQGIDPWQIVPERLGHTNKETTKGYIWFDAVRNKRIHILEKLSLEKPNYKNKDETQ